MTTITATADHHDHEHHHDSDSIDVFGFWIYIMTDCILFATLFAAFAVLNNAHAAGPTLKQIFDLPYVFGETMFLLASSFTYGLAMLGFYKKSKARALSWLVVTFFLGLSFVIMEVREFIHLYAAGNSWHVSAALSSFFTLVATHGTHVSIGLLWMLVMMFQLIKYGISPGVSRRLTYLGLFWHFLDIVWIFVFTIVYLMSSI